MPTISTQVFPTPEGLTDAPPLRRGPASHTGLHTMRGVLCEEGGGYAKRVLKGMTELVDTTHGKFGMVATLEDVEFAGNLAFAPVHVGQSCMMMLRALLRKHVPK